MAVHVEPFCADFSFGIETRNRCYCCNKCWERRHHPRCRQKCDPCRLPGELHQLRVWNNPLQKNQFKNVVSQINHQVVPISLSAHFKLKRTMILEEKRRREMNPPVKETAETKPERKAERECCRCSKPGAWDLDRHQRDVEAKVPTFANA